MPRQARLDFPGCLHHVINRGIEKRSIFLNSQDFRYFREALGDLVEECRMRCFAWVLMKNHFHLLVETGPIPLSTFMSRLQTRYAGYFNRKIRRVGRLFQNRYKSIICDKDTYFRELVAYIHLNPLRAGLVKDLAELNQYPWSGQRVLMGFERAVWQRTDEVLAQFGGTERRGRENYFRYLMERKGIKQDLSGGGLVRSAGGFEMVKTRRPAERESYDSRILGDGDFVDAVLEKNVFSDDSDKPKARIDLDDLIRRVISEKGIGEEEIFRPGKTTRKGVSGRAIIIFLAAKFLEKKKVELADRLRISESAVSQLYEKGVTIVEGEKKKWESEIYLNT